MFSRKLEFKPRPIVGVVQIIWKSKTEINDTMFGYCSYSVSMVEEPRQQSELQWLAEKSYVYRSKRPHSSPTVCIPWTKIEGLRTFYVVYIQAGCSAMGRCFDSQSMGAHGGSSRPTLTPSRCHLFGRPCQHHTKDITAWL